MESTSSAAKNSDICKKAVQKLGRDYLSEPMRNELIQVNVNLAEATQEYFKYKLIVDCVKKFLDVKVEKKAKNKEQGILSDPLYLTAVKKYVSADGIQPFGITEDFLNSTISRKKKTQKEKEELNEFVEDEIHNFCVKITEYTGYAQRYRSNPQRAFRESMKDLSSELDDLSVAKYKLDSEKEEINDLVLNYFEDLVQGITMLKSLVSLHQKKLEFQSDLRIMYESSEETIASKINRFEYKVLFATYNKHTIEVLTKIRAELDEEKESLDNDLNSTNSELHSYCILGQQYCGLVDEYAELLKQTQLQKWAIESLKRRQSLGNSLSDKEDLISFEEEVIDCSKIQDIANRPEIKETLDSSKIEDALDSSKIEETLDSSKAVETECCSGAKETLDCSEANETECTGVGETLNCSEAEETLDCSDVNDTDCTGISETLNCTEAEETLNCSEVNETNYTVFGETMNCSELEDTMDCSETNETDCTGVGETLNRSEAEGTLDRSEVDETNCIVVSEISSCSEAEEKLGYSETNKMFRS